VGRLAARHGIKVRLRRAQSGGLSALIWVPETVAETEPAAAVGSRRRFGTNTGSQQVVISSPAAAVNAARTPVMGVRTIARPKSIWFDTGDEDQAPEPGPPASVVMVEPPAPQPEPAAASADEASGVRLPIFDSIESEWFRRGGTTFSAGGSAAGSWTSPADEGFRRAAETIGSPATGQLTNAGLPQRMPSANLVPGSVGVRPAGPRPQPAKPPADGPSRSPEAVRARLTGFQMRGREGRTDEPE